MTEEQAGTAWDVGFFLPLRSFVFFLLLSSVLVSSFRVLLLLSFNSYRYRSAFMFFFSVAFFSLRSQEFWDFTMRMSLFSHFALSLFHIEPEVKLVAVWFCRK